MPHPDLDAHVHLDKHPKHSSAVTATLAGPGTHTACALLTLHGFEVVTSHRMILARIDHEEPHYANQAARTLRQEGITVDITPGLQEDIDTEWTWANFPCQVNVFRSGTGRRRRQRGRVARGCEGAVLPLTCGSLRLRKGSAAPAPGIGKVVVRSAEISVPSVPLLSTCS
ncbi:hypothetical protein ACQUSR_27430 [Streptomyces sp. P1-3]|uniref:hypothetical protein n=1 Tax=Streptomyces sp. P1-3 TaxID=3421658 RepID=UPI003D35E318